MQEKKLVDKLIEERTKNIEETRLVEKTSAEDKNNHKYNSCTLYIVLFSVFFTISIGIATHFVYHKCISRNKENVSKYDYIYQTTTIQ